jgi:hypothetical protein
MSYTSDIRDRTKYVAWVLNGEKPGDLSARLAGRLARLPASSLATANEVIE